MDLLQRLLDLAPIIGQMTGHEEVATLLARLGNIADEEVRRRMASRNQSREEILRDAGEAWSRAVQGADELLSMGHESKEEKQ